MSSGTRVWGAVDGIGGFLAGENGDDVSRRHLGHTRSRGVAGAPDVGRDDDVGEGVEGVVVGEGLGDGHIEGGAADGARPERLDERVLVHDATAGRIHEDGGLLHGGELGGANQVLGLGAVGDVKRDEVGAREELGQGHALNAELALDLGVGGAGGSEHGHAEAAGAARDGAADLAQTDDAEGGAESVVAEEVRGRPRLPAALSGYAFALYEVAGGGEEEGEGEVGGGLVEDAGRVRDPDTRRRRGHGVEVVVADGHVGDDAQAGGLGQEIGADGVGDEGKGSVGLAEVLTEGGGRWGKLVGPDSDLVAGFFEELDRATGKAAGYEYLTHDAPSVRITTGLAVHERTRRYDGATLRHIRPPGDERRSAGMGSKEIAALIEILTRENTLGQESHVLGSWTISFDKAKGAFVFDKCENDGYCEERPSVIGVGGEVLDPGGPLFA